MNKETILRKLENVETLLRERQYKEASEAVSNLVGALEAELLTNQDGLSDFDKKWLQDNYPGIAIHDPAKKATKQASDNIKSMFGLDDGR